MKLSITCNRNYLLLLIVVLVVLSSSYYMSLGRFHTKLNIKQNVDHLRDTHSDSLNGTRSREVLPSNTSDSSKQEVSHTLTSDFLLSINLRGASVITRSKTAWSRDDRSCDGDQSFVKTQLRSPAGNTPIYVHPAKTDMWVSGSIIGGNVWEKNTVTKFYNLLKKNPELYFIDIGANIGIYGLTMAKLGRKVLMVEPLLSNVQKLCHSVRDGRFQDVYVLHNAMSSRRFSVGFGTHKGNVGGTYVRNVTSDKEETSYAILLDDLLDVFRLNKVAIKLDVETHEAEVLAGGDNFFTSVDVRYLMVEWHGDKKTSGKGIIDFLTRHKMAPYHPGTDKALDTNQYKNWPGDVIWKKVL